MSSKRTRRAHRGESPDPLLLDDDSARDLKLADPHTPFANKRQKTSHPSRPLKTDPDLDDDEDDELMLESSPVSKSEYGTASAKRETRLLTRTKATKAVKRRISSSGTSGGGSRSRSAGRSQKKGSSTKRKEDIEEETQEQDTYIAGPSGTTAEDAEQEGSGRVEEEVIEQGEDMAQDIKIPGAIDMVGDDDQIDPNLSVDIADSPLQEDNSEVSFQPTSFPQPSVITSPLGSSTAPLHPSPTRSLPRFKHDLLSPTEAEEPSTLSLIPDPTQSSTSHISPTSDQVLKDSRGLGPVVEDSAEQTGPENHQKGEGEQAEMVDVAVGELAVAEYMEDALEPDEQQDSIMDVAENAEEETADRAGGEALPEQVDGEEGAGQVDVLGGPPEVESMEKETKDEEQAEHEGEVGDVRQISSLGDSEAMQEDEMSTSARPETLAVEDMERQAIAMKKQPTESLVAARAIPSDTIDISTTSGIPASEPSTSTPLMQMSDAQNAVVSQGLVSMAAGQHDDSLILQTNSIANVPQAVSEPANQTEASPSTLEILSPHQENIKPQSSPSESASTSTSPIRNNNTKNNKKQAKPTRVGRQPKAKATISTTARTQMDLLLNARYNEKGEMILSDNEQEKELDQFLRDTGGLIDVDGNVIPEVVEDDATEVKEAGSLGQEVPVEDTMKADDPDEASPILSRQEQKALEKAEAKAAAKALKAIRNATYNERGEMIEQSPKKKAMEPVSSQAESSRTPQETSSVRKMGGGAKGSREVSPPVDIMDLSDIGLSRAARKLLMAEFNAKGEIIEGSTQADEEEDERPSKKLKTGLESKPQGRPKGSGKGKAPKDFRAATPSQTELSYEPEATPFASTEDTASLADLNEAGLPQRKKRGPKKGWKTAASDPTGSEPPLTPSKHNKKASNKVERGSSGFATPEYTPERPSNVKKTAKASKVLHEIPSPQSHAVTKKPSEEPAQSRRTKQKYEVIAESDADAEKEEEDQTVYCICRKKFSEDGSAMVECDLCQNWYHFECMGMEESKLPLIEQYICPNCEKDPLVSDRTSWKTKCRREACHQPDRIPLSKYCSEACGIHQTLALLKASNIDPSQVLQAVSAAHRPEGLTQPRLTPLDTSLPTRNGINFTQWKSNAEDTFASEKKRYKVQQGKLEADLLRLERQEAKLATAIARSDSLPALVYSVEEITNKPGRKGKGAAGTVVLEERPCGFDLTLLEVDGETPEEELPSPEANKLCMIGRKKCKRHAGWQDIKKDEMELQRENLINDLDKVQRRLAGVQLRHSVELGSLITEEMKEDVKVQDSEAVNRDEGPHRDGVEIVGMELD